eukprot:6217116-Amphidinium_carterae.1
MASFVVPRANAKANAAGAICNMTTPARYPSLSGHLFCRSKLAWAINCQWLQKVCANSGMANSKDLTQHSTAPCFPVGLLTTNVIDTSRITDSDPHAGTSLPPMHVCNMQQPHLNDNCSPDMGTHSNFEICHEAVMIRLGSETYACS